MNVVMIYSRSNQRLLAGNETRNKHKIRLPNYDNQNETHWPSSERDNMILILCKLETGTLAPLTPVASVGWDGMHFTLTSFSNGPSLPGKTYTHTLKYPYYLHDSRVRSYVDNERSESSWTFLFLLCFCRSDLQIRSVRVQVFLTICLSHFHHNPKIYREQDRGESTLCMQC